MQCSKSVSYTHLDVYKRQAYYDSKAKETVKIGYGIENEQKVRINKKTGKALDKTTKKKK